MRGTHATSSPRWPFWLLIAAWVCANTPQAATCSILGWLAEARHFSHQQQLTREVAHLLGGEKLPPRSTATAADAGERETSAPTPAVPAGAVLKKIDLASEKEGTLAGPIAMALRLQRPAHRFGVTFRAPPLHGPPRAAVTA